ncbi:MAG: glycosyltransferase [Nitrospiraceae bacterium]|nr:glycosyltransferase [Nitrospiraceae bacterium]
MNEWQKEFDKIYCNGEFDHDWYLKEYPDVKLTGLSPLEHYVKYGRRMKRKPSSQSNDVLLKEIQIESRPLVSVLCITYNHENYISQAIESILNQVTDFEYELLIGNDCSTDKTHDIISDYHKKSKRIRYFNSTVNVGANRNFIDLASKSRGKYVAICEGDDYWTDINKLQTQVNFLSENPEYTICFHPVKVLNNKNLSVKKVFPSSRPLRLSIEGLLRENFIQTNSVMYRWRFNKTHPLDFPDNIAPADWYIHLLHAEVGRIGYLDKVMGVYRKHDSGMWSSHSNALSRFKKLGNNELALYRLLEARYGPEYQFDNAQIYILSSLAKYYLESGDFENILDLINNNKSHSPRFMKILGYEVDKNISTVEHLKSILIMQSRVDIIVTSYNHEKYISRCLESVLNQKGILDIRIIVGDDCSNDTTMQIIHEYASKHPGKILVVERSKNVGMLKNMQMCINQCDAKYIAFCEADDYWISDRYLEKKLAVMRVNPNIGMCFNWLLLNTEDIGSFLPHESQGRLETGEVTFQTLKESPLTANFSCCMYTREALLSVPPSYYDRENAADWLLNLYVADKYKVYFYREMLSVYTIHSKGQWSGIDSVERARLEQSYKEEFSFIFDNRVDPLEVVVREILNFNDRRDILRCLDQPRAGINAASDGSISVSGWILMRSREKYTILIKEGERVQKIYPSISRSDVINSVYGYITDDYESKCGFFAEINVEEKVQIDIVLLNRNEVIPWISIDIF